MFDPFRDLLQNKANGAMFNLERILPIVVAIVALVGLYYAIRHFYLDKRALKKEKKELGVKITKISAKPWIKNGQGGRILGCYVDVDIKNPDSENNELDFSVLSPKSNVVYVNLKNRTLPALVTTSFRIDLEDEIYSTDEAVNKIKGQKLLLRIRDIHGSETNQYFTFKDSS